MTLTNKLDQILVNLCDLVLSQHNRDPKKYGMVGSAILDPDGKVMLRASLLDGKISKHAERTVIDAYTAKYGQIPKGSILITTLSPCNENRDETARERFGTSCTDLINQVGIKNVYSGYTDPTQSGNQEKFKIVTTKNKSIKNLCKMYADTFLYDQDWGSNN